MDSKRLFYCCSCDNEDDARTRQGADIGILYRIDPDDQEGIGDKAMVMGVGETENELQIAQLEISTTTPYTHLTQSEETAGRQTQSMPLAEGLLASLGWTSENAGLDEITIGAGRPSSPGNASPGSMREDQKDNLGWVNYILQSTWPHTRIAVNNLAKKIVSQQVQAAIRERNRLGFKIDIKINTTFDIGSNPPILTNVVATHTMGAGVKGQEGVELLASVEMSAAADFHFELAVAGRVSGLPVNTSVGLSSFSLFGNVCVLLAPIIDSLPIFAGGKIYFLDLPNLHMVFFGMPSAGKLLGPILVAAVQTTAEQILQSFVVPGGVYVPMAPIPPANVVPIATPPPYGFVLVTVYEARGVFGGDWSLFSKETSDPSVTIKLGGTSFITSYHTNTSRPVWDPPESGFLPLFHQNQQLYIDVTDVDLGDRRDLLGQYSGTVQKVHERLEGKDWLQMELTDMAKEAGGVNPPPMEVLLQTEYLEVVDLGPENKIVTELPKGESHPFGGPRGLTVDYVPLLRLCSVTLSGIESSDGRMLDDLLYSTAIVTIEPGKPPKNWTKEKKASVLYRGLESIGRKLFMSDSSGGTLKQPPMKSRKARAWGPAGGDSERGNLHNVSGHSQLMIERLAIDKNMTYAEIAEISGLPEAEVKLVVEMQRTLNVVWYQSFHRLLEYPGGKVTVEVIKEDKTSIGKVTVDLEEVENIPQKTRVLKARKPLSGQTDLTLVFQIELKGLHRSKMTHRRGHKSYKELNLKSKGRKVITASKSPSRQGSFRRTRSQSSE